jgi:hypothetical protein
MSLGRNFYKGVPRQNLGKVTTESGSLATLVGSNSVVVSSIPEVVVSSATATTITGTVAVSSLPNVTIDTMPSVTVGSMPSVTIGSMPSVTTVSGTLNQGVAASATAANAWPVRIVGGNGDYNVNVDTYTGSLITTELEHYEIHNGRAFSIGVVSDVAGAGTNRDYLLITPALKIIHFRFTYKTEAEFDVSIQEEPTVSNNGTPIPTYDRNRISSNSAELAVYHTPTVTLSGTTLRIERTGSGSTTGGSTEAQSEWIFKKNSKYLMRFNKIGSSTHYISLRLWWYEI